MKKRKPYKYRGWAIEARSSGPLANETYLLGRYWFGPPPSSMLGHHICLFATRKEARAHVPKPWEVNGNKQWYVVVPVWVTVK